MTSSSANVFVDIGNAPPNNFEAYLTGGGALALSAFRDSSPGFRLKRLEQTGARIRLADGPPLSWAFERFVRSRGSSSGQARLIVDATGFDPRALTQRLLVEQRALVLIEAALMMVAAAGPAKLIVRLAKQSPEAEIQLGDAVRLWRGYPLGEDLHLNLHVETGAASIYSSAQDTDAFHLPVESWFTLLEAFTNIREKPRPARAMLTVERPKTKPHMAYLGRDDLVSSLFPDQQGIRALSFDQGMSGFLPIDSLETFDPHSLAEAGVFPGASTVEPLPFDRCPVDVTRQALLKHWRLCPAASAKMQRQTLAQAARMCAELAMGRGGPDYLTELTRLSNVMLRKDMVAGFTLKSALNLFADDFFQHAHGHCATGDCRRREAAPCQRACPSGIDIPNFMALAARGDPVGAVAVMVKDNPLPHICGLVCPAPCEKVCLRAKLDAPVRIRAMKAFASSQAQKQTGHYPPVCATGETSGKRVAVVGAGPSGLTCAHFLTTLGHKVTVYEAQQVAGGMTRFGIPEYRLPRNIIEQEAQNIADLGVEFHYGQRLGEDFTIESLKRDGFDAVFLGLGAWESREAGLLGEEDMPGVLSGTRFLVELHQGHKPPELGRTIIIGGGNTAMDCARVAIRLGAREVRVVYRRGRTDMPADPHEVTDAMAEGVQFEFLSAPADLVSENGVLTGLTVLRQRSLPPDERGRRGVEPIPGSETTIPCDILVLAIGQFCDPGFATRGHGEVCFTRYRTIKVDPVTLATDEEGVFAGGDAASGPATVVEAVGAGKRAAHSIDAYLRGCDFDPAIIEARPRFEQKPLIVCTHSDRDLVPSDIPMLSVAARVDNFRQVELGLSAEMAETESQRCLRCDVCIGCGLCELTCSEVGAEALRFGDTGDGRLVFTNFGLVAERCVGCGSCTQVCPTGAMRLTSRPGVRSLFFTGHPLAEHRIRQCTQCGTDLPPDSFMEQIRTRLGPLAASANLGSNLCPACAGRAITQGLTAGLFNMPKTPGYSGTATLKVPPPEPRRS